MSQLSRPGIPELNDAVLIHMGDGAYDRPAVGRVSQPSQSATGPQPRRSDAGNGLRWQGVAESIEVLIRIDLRKRFVVRLGLGPRLVDDGLGECGSENRQAQHQKKGRA